MNTRCEQGASAGQWWLAVRVVSRQLQVGVGACERLQSPQVALLLTTYYGLASNYGRLGVSGMPTDSE